MTPEDESDRRIAREKQETEREITSRHLKHLEAKVVENWKEVLADIYLFRDREALACDVIDSLASFEAAVREHQTELLKAGAK